MTAPDAFQAKVARLALAVAGEHGFALAGGHALIAHGIVSRPTVDVDLFTDASGGVQAAAELVAVALSAAGLTVEIMEDTSELGDLFYGFESDMVEFEVRHGEHAVQLQLVRFDRLKSPVVMDIGPVLHLDDVIGTKVAAMANRAQPRDFIDVAAALTRYTREQVTDLGRQADPALSDEEFAEAMRRLDRLDDPVFELYGRTPDQIAEIRERFADWSRST
jgi:hypothetical protein